MAFVVSLEPASGKPVTVSYETADGTAKAGEDYTAVSATTLTFTAGETAKTVSVATAEDTRNEDQEAFTVTLSGQTNATLGTASATGTIDDDDGEPELRIAGATVSEGEPVAFVVSLVPASGKPVTVSYETADGTAKAGEDYTAVSATTLTFTAGETAKTVSVATVEDTRNEDQEAFTVTLSGQTNAALGTSIATGTIDDDDGEPELRIAGATVSEGEPVAFVVSLEPASGKPVTVSYETADGTAKAGEDYTAVSATTLTFTAGETAKTVSVATAEDTRNEDQEEFTVTLSGQTNAALGTASATGTIDDDDGEPELRIAGATVSEGEPVAFVVSLVPASGKPVTVSYETADGTAKAGEDYTAVSATTLTFTAGETAKTVSVATVEDTRNEDQEAFTVTLSGQTNAALGTASATGTIDDDDGEPELRIAGATVSEGEPVAFVVSLQPASGKPVTVSYETADGTAEAGEDYTAVSATTLTFTAGETAKTVSVATAEDTRNEDQEAFTVTLSGQTNATLGTASATGTIDDDDGEPELRIAGATVSEGEPVAFVVSLVPASGKPVTVSYETDDGTAEAGEDYTAVSATTLTFTAGETAKTVSVATAEDTRNEDQEAFTVTLSGQTNAALGTAIATGTIDDDDGEPELRIAGATVSEGEPVAFVVSLVPASGKPVTVSYETSDGTAEAGEDYTAVSETTLTFTAGETAKTVSVATEDDQLDEADGETFTITLSSPGNATRATDGTTATGTINDNDVLSAEVSADSVSVDEGKDAVFTVSVKDGTSTADVVVEYAVDETSTATADEDYTAPSPTLTIKSGETSGKITIKTLDTDEVLDPGETLVVKLTGATTDTRTVTVDTNARVMTTIADTDQVTVSVSAVTIEDDPGTDENEFEDKSVVAEGQSAMFVVELSGEVSSEVQVSYETSDDTGANAAVAGEDYTAVSATTLTFAAGDTAKTVEVATLEDDLDEPDETFTLKINAPDPAVLGVSLGTSSSATGTIVDTDALEVSITEHTANVSEGETATLTVSLSEGSMSTAPVIVKYEVGGDATLNADYTMPSSPLTIATGEASATISIEALEDYLEEQEQKVTVTLESATSSDRPVMTVDTTTVEVTIANVPMGDFVFKTPDSESSGNSASVQVSRTRRSAAAEEAGQAETIARKSTEAECDFPCLLEGDPASKLPAYELLAVLEANDGTPVEIEGDQTIEVSYATSDGTAIADVDYVALDVTLTLTRGNTGFTIPLETIPDTIHEDDETFSFLIKPAERPDGTFTNPKGAELKIRDDDPLVAADSGPTVVLSSSGSFPATGTFTVNIEFSASVTGFESTELRVANGRPHGFGGSGTTYTVRVTPKDELHGHVTVTVPADVAVDADDDTRSNVEGWKRFSVNTTTSPTVTIESWDDFPAHGAFDVTIRFSETVSDFTLGDIGVTNGTAGNFTGAPVRHVLGGESHREDDFEGDVIVTVPARTRHSTRTTIPNGNHPREVKPLPGEPDVADGDDRELGRLSGARGIRRHDPVLGERERLHAGRHRGHERLAGETSSGTGATYSVEITPEDDFAGDVIVTVPANAAFDDDKNGNQRGSEPFEVDTRLVQVDVSFGAAAYTALEDGSPATVTVLLSADPERTLVIPLTSRNGKGASDADYTGVPEQVTFASGQTSRTFTVTATSDIDEDAGETVTLGFGELPAAVKAGSPANATITLAGESSKTRYARVMSTLLPRAAAAMSDATVGAISNRIDNVGSQGNLSLAGVSVLPSASLAAQERSADTISWASRDQTTRNISSAQLMDGSSFVMTLADRARLAGAADPSGSNPGTAALWGSGDYRNLAGSESALAWRGNLVSLHLGADLVALPELVAGVAVARSLVGFDYTDRTNPRTVTGTFETDLLSVHPYASWTPAFGLGFWATGGLGWGAGRHRRQPGRATNQHDPPADRRVGSQQPAAVSRRPDSGWRHGAAIEGRRVRDAGPGRRKRPDRGAGPGRAARAVGVGGQPRAARSVGEHSDPGVGSGAAP